VDVHVDEAWGYDGSGGIEEGGFGGVEIGSDRIDFSVSDEDIGYGVEILGWIDYAAAFD
jgi:hypothetical protein